MNTAKKLVLHLQGNGLEASLRERLNIKTMKDYIITKETGLKYSFLEMEGIFIDLSQKILVQGANLINGQYLQLSMKDKKNTNNVKSILKKHFNIEFKKTYSIELGKEIMFCEESDIIKLCKIYLENNFDLDYCNRFDPLGIKNKVSKRVYQYGAVRYDLLHV